MSANAPRAAGDQDNFSGLPLIPVVLPVVQNAPGVPAAQASDETEVKEKPDAGESFVVKYGEVLALLGEPCKEQDGQGEERI